MVAFDVRRGLASCINSDNLQIAHGLLEKNFGYLSTLKRNEESRELREMCYVLGGTFCKETVPGNKKWRELAILARDVRLSKSAYWAI